MLLPANVLISLIPAASVNHFVVHDWTSHSMPTVSGNHVDPRVPSFPWTLVCSAQVAMLTQKFCFQCEEFYFPWFTCNVLKLFILNPCCNLQPSWYQWHLLPLFTIWMSRAELPGYSYWTGSHVITVFLLTPKMKLMFIIFPVNFSCFTYNQKPGWYPWFVMPPETILI